MSKILDNTPLVSIIITVYNGYEYLKEAIDSASSQTYENIEVIVVNDGSNDDGKTKTIALSYGDSIRYFEKENGGVSSALNFGISKMNGKYFSWLSHDDVYLKDKIANQVALFKKYDFRDDLVALCEYTTINSVSKIIAYSADRFENENISWQNALYDVLKNGSYCGCAFLIPKQVLLNAGLFDENMRYLQDTKMWKIIFSNKIDLIYSHNRDVLSRVHEKQLTQTGRKLFNSEFNSEFKIVLPLLVGISNQENNFLYAYAQRCAHYGNKKLTFECIKNARNAAEFKATQIIKLCIVLICGKLRPTVRRLYYRIFRNMKVT